MRDIFGSNNLKESCEEQRETQGVELRPLIRTSHKNNNKMSSVNARSLSSEEEILNMKRTKQGRASVLPDDFGAALKQGASHRQLLKHLKNKQLGERVGSETYLSAILRRVTNGDVMLRRRMDESVSDNDVDENAPHYGIVINFCSVFGGGGTDDAQSLRELLASRGSSLLVHPVVEAFLELKWRRISIFFQTTFLLYCVFLTAFSFFLGNIFYRESSVATTINLADLRIENDQVVFPVSKMKPKFFDTRTSFGEEDAPTSSDYTNELFNKTKHVFYSCSTNYHMACGAEVTLATSASLLLLQEFVQCLALGPRAYFSEFENALEVSVLVLALISLATQPFLAIFRWISAIGICLAYLELIFLSGRYPRLGGTVSLMFYSIISHMAKTLTSFLVLVAGFAFGFFIVFHGKDSDHFSNPLLAVVKTLCMVLGEFEFDDLYSSQADDPAAQIFTVALLVGLCIVGSLVLVNLIVAIIVSDIEQLNRDARVQEAANKAQHVIQAEAMIAILCCCLPPLKRMLKLPEEIVVCPHSRCVLDSCQGVSLEKDLVQEMRGIVKRRRINQALANIVALNDNDEEDSNDENRRDRALAGLVRAVIGAVNDNSGDKANNNNNGAFLDLVTALME